MATQPLHDVYTSPATLHSYTATTRRFDDFMASTHPGTQSTTAHVHQFLDSERTQGYAPATVAMRLSALKATLLHLRDQWPQIGGRTPRWRQSGLYARGGHYVRWDKRGQRYEVVTSPGSRTVHKVGVCRGRTRDEALQLACRRVDLLEQQ